MKLTFTKNLSTMQIASSHLHQRFFSVCGNHKLRNRSPFHKSFASLFTVTMSHLYLVKSRRNAIVIARVVPVWSTVVVDIAEVAAVVVIRWTKPPPVRTAWQRNYRDLTYIEILYYFVITLIFYLTYLFFKPLYTIYSRTDYEIDI